VLPRYACCLIVCRLIGSSLRSTSTGVRRRGAPRQQRAASEPGELWTIDQVADHLGVPKQTVYCWRTSGYGPTGFRVGKHVRWRASTVIAWTLERQR
jgi:predicted DNA-binding transcriptional regulator AlpA